jgi:hypothetical protein
LFIEANPRGYAAGNECSSGSCDGKSAEYEEKLGRGDLPLLLQFVKHDAKRRKNMVSTTKAEF